MSLDGPDVAPDVTLRADFHSLYRRQRLFGKSPETVRLYGFTFNYFRDCLGREATRDDLCNETIMQCMEWIVAQGLSLRSANKFRDQICALWRFLRDEGLILKGPRVPALPEPERSPIAWTEDQLAALWKMFLDQKGWICGVPSSLYYIALHSIAWDSLERIGAIRQLRWSDLAGQWLKFRAETRKGRRKENIVKLDQTTLEILESIRLPKRELIFPWDKNRTYFWTKHRNMRKKVGLPDDRMHSFHCTRVTGASFAEAAGADATKLLLHGNRKTTERHYLDPRVIPRIHGADVLFRPGSLPPVHGDG